MSGPIAAALRIFAVGCLSFVSSVCRADDGPFNAEFIAGGSSLAKVTAARDGSFPWLVQGWLHPDEAADGVQSLMRFAPVGPSLVLDHNHLALFAGDKPLLRAPVALAPGKFVWVAASFDANGAALWQDGALVGRVALAPVRSDGNLLLGARSPGEEGFAGQWAGLTLMDGSLTPERAAGWAANPPNADLIVFERASPQWPVQLKQILGQAAPQDAWTLPKSRAPFSAPQAKPLAPTPGLRADGADRWILGGFELQAAPQITEDGAYLSQPEFHPKGWLAATVPGTVLTSMVDRGLYPDPDFGLNNMAIPERLSHQDYWYHSNFRAPADPGASHWRLVFEGINYRAEIWLNGHYLGPIEGAFARGVFEIADILRPGGDNALAIKIAPPPHPGIAHEQSISAGVGENGGMQALDGPTFIASEGWDWIPGVRDRNSGLWQDVRLERSGAVSLGDPQVITALNLPEHSRAELTFLLPVHNGSNQPMATRISAAFDDVALSKDVILAPGDSEISLNAAEFPQLRIDHPKLWWPNGLGEPVLHDLHLAVAIAGQNSDHRDLRFGMREISYELSLLDAGSHLRRVELEPSHAPGVALIDGRHEAIRKIEGGWVQSLSKEGKDSKAVKPLPADTLTPYLVLKVNGVRLPARGGSWGTDDWRKRVSRAHLEPFFRLHRNAHINIIRNWVGQNSEEVFYQLADEYGLLILNDFWASTQDFNIEPEDVPLFLANAGEVVRRFRHHPSIALWFGRNEGVPQPILNEGMAALINRLDGTRLYMGSSNRVNLQDSGPYDYREPASYFTTHSKGFAVELGTPSFPTLEAFKAAIPPEDWWPINDVWAYHDWHQSGNGATQKFMAAMARKFGAATSLEDFERKAQMLNYESHRAIFEGMNSGLWRDNSGRMLWMTQPAWPSTNWQIMSSDYDTHGAYYGFQKAAEPLHAQLDLPDFGVTLVNNLPTPQNGMVLRAEIYRLDGEKLAGMSAKADLPALSTRKGMTLDLARYWSARKPLLVRLELDDRKGATVSTNLYWQAEHDADLQALNAMTAQPVTLAASTARRDNEAIVTVTINNPGREPALLNKVTLLHADGSRVLPAYASDNYVSLLPGESRKISIALPADQAEHEMLAAVRGWNSIPFQAAVTPIPAK